MNEPVAHDQERLEGDSDTTRAAKTAALMASYRRGLRRGRAEVSAAQLLRSRLLPAATTS